MEGLAPPAGNIQGSKEQQAPEARNSGAVQPEQHAQQPSTSYSSVSLGGFVGQGQAPAIRQHAPYPSAATSQAQPAYASPLGGVSPYPAQSSSGFQQSSMQQGTRQPYASSGSLMPAQQGIPQPYAIGSTVSQGASTQKYPLPANQQLQPVGRPAGSQPVAYPQPLSQNAPVMLAGQAAPGQQLYLPGGQSQSLLNASQPIPPRPMSCQLGQQGYRPPSTVLAAGSYQARPQGNYMVQQGTGRPAGGPIQAVGLGQPGAPGQPGTAVQLRPYTPYRPPASLHPGEYSYPRPGFNMSQQLAQPYMPGQPGTTGQPGMYLQQPLSQPYPGSMRPLVSGGLLPQGQQTYTPGFNPNSLYTGGVSMAQGTYARPSAGRSMTQPMQPGMQAGARPGMSQPGMMQPGVSQPGMSQPGMSQPLMGQPSAQMRPMVSQGVWQQGMPSGSSSMMRPAGRPTAPMSQPMANGARPQAGYSGQGGPGMQPQPGMQQQSGMPQQPGMQQQAGASTPASPPSQPGMPPTSAAPGGPGTNQTKRSGARPVRPASSSGSKKHCNCKNSRCLKLYCECFASGRYCDNCNCVSCCNNKDNEATRQAAVENILDRNPNAFRPKIQEQEGTAAVVVAGFRHNKGCNCKKSGCLKKYCECFQAAIYCSESCKCMDCKNFQGSTAREVVMQSHPLDRHGRASLPDFAPKRMRVLPPSSAAPTGAFTASLNAPSGPGTLGSGLVSSAPPALAALQDTMREMVKRGGIEEMASLLLLVANEEAERLQKAGAEDASGQAAAEDGDAAANVTLDASQATVGDGFDTNGDVKMADASTAAKTGKESGTVEGEPDAAAPAASAVDVSGSRDVDGGEEASELYKAQERAVLQEYHFILNKLLDRVHKKTKEHEAIAVLQRSANAQYALSSGQQGGPPHTTQPPAYPAGRPPAPRPPGVLSPQGSAPSSTQPFAGIPQSAPGVASQNSAAGVTEMPNIQVSASGGKPSAVVPLPGASFAFPASTRPQNYIPGVSPQNQLLRQPVLSTLGDPHTQQIQQTGLSASAQQPGFAERQPGTGVTGTSIPAPGLPSAQPSATGQPGYISPHPDNPTVDGATLQGLAKGPDGVTGEQRDVAGSGAQADSIEAAGQLLGSNAGTPSEGPARQQGFSREEPLEMLL